MRSTMDYVPRFDNEEDGVGDPFMEDDDDDPTKIFNIPPKQFADELDSLAIDERESYDNDGWLTHDDAQSWIEDMDEDGEA